jgi:Na+-translocating ferredoxin:NAD+ oxidoreductase subunit A
MVRPLRLLAAAALLALAPVAARAGDVIRHVRVMAPNTVKVFVDQPVARTDAANFRFSEASAPDAPMTVKAVDVQPGVVTLTVDQTLYAGNAYRLEIAEPPAARDVRPPAWALLFAVFLSSALINNFVFTRYLGLCVFFGVSKKRDTAIGMGITFTLVMLLTSMISWALYTFVMRPLHLGFLQIIVFIGVVAFFVQLLDTILKKVMPALHRAFGIYLVLITTNCIILAVPLLNATANATALDALALALGSGLGFALALFLMSCAREKMELARVPKAFEGLPIAFALTGLFALAFMGFSGLDFFR